MSRLLEPLVAFRETFITRHTFDQPAFEKLQVRAEDVTGRLKAVVQRIAGARARVAQAGIDPRTDTELRDLESAANQIHLELVAIETEMLEVSGIPAEVIDAIEEQQVRGDSIDRTPRRSVVAAELPSTGMLDDLIPAGLERFLAISDPDWLRDQRRLGHELSEAFRREPLALTRGSRIASELQAAHRFALTVFNAEDFVSGQPGYDWLLASSLLPQLAAFESAYDSLTAVGGDTQDRIRSLWAGDTRSFDSTMFELLVGAACARKGRAIASLPREPGVRKTPDFEVSGYPFPVFVECKRRETVLEADVREDAAITALFRAIRRAALSRARTGIVELTLSIPVETVSVPDVVDAFVRQPFAINPRRPTSYPWGSLTFREIPRKVTFSDTRLYSPRFLNAVFGWDTDLPSHDGIVCQVDDPGTVLVSEARNPLALLWNDDSPETTKRCGKSAASLFGSAMPQMPAGSVGIIYVAYNEGHREEIADERMRLLQERLQDVWHDWHIRVPVAFINRLIPRPLGDGAPDLVETSLRLISDLYGSSKWFEDFPSLAFTLPRLKD